jgi:2-hydroxycyclohexanecarboxyl-CoA dehydrogenase
LEAEGCRVAVWDLADGAECKVDVSDYAAVRAALAETEARLGPVEHLVHAAAIGSGKFGFPFTNLQPADWKRVLEVNILGMVHVAQALADGMAQRKAGTMVFIASIAGQIGSQTDPPYSASKAANINFAQCLAKDMAPHGVRVNTVNPGMVKTPLNENVWRSWNARQAAGKQRSYEEWAGEKVKAVAPLGRWQETQDIADMVVFLSSERARQVTGQTINVDGGQVMHW